MISTYDFKLTKLNATGNDFLFVNALNQNIHELLLGDFESRSEFAKWVCQRKYNIGADGLVFVEKPVHGENNLKWDFYNSDGSSAEMCGNAARCMGVYAIYNNLAPRIFSFESLAGAIGVEVLENDFVEVEMTPAKDYQGDLILNINNNEITYHFVNTGVPHVVIEQKKLTTDSKQFEISKLIRFHKNFGPQGTNVSYFQVLSENKLKAVTFERGVDDFTLACGTGAVACAFAYRQAYKIDDSVELKVPGGELFVNVTHKKPKLTGPAQFVGDVKLYRK